MADDQPFARFLEHAAEGTPDARRGIVDEYLRRVAYPVFEDDSTVVLLYRGDVEGVSLIGDMTEWIEAIPFRRIPGTDLFWFRGTYEPDARLEYVLQLSGRDALIADPLNPHAVNGFVLNSELAMPRYRRRPVFDPFLDGRKGGYELLQEFVVPAGVLPYPHRVHVYTPPGYASGDQSHSCVYFQDGRDYIEYGIAPLVLQTLIEGGGIAPVIGVFVTPPNLHLPETPNRTTEYGMNGEYVAFFTEELCAWVDGHIRTRRDPSARLVVGDSYGGLISATIGLRRPDVFGSAYSQSGYFSFRNDQFLKELGGTERIGCRFYLDCGTYEHRVGRGIVPDDEGNFIAANQRTALLMRDCGVEVVYREYPEGHTWGNWRAHLCEALIHFFRTQGIGEG
jgi:enterochelin esterase family protein